MLLDAGLTVVWQEPLTALYTGRSQDELSSELERLERREGAERRRERAHEQARRAGNGRAGARRLRRRERARVARARQRRVAELRDSLEPGDAVGRIEIADLDVDFVFAEGTDEDSLRLGPARYQETSLPGAGKTIGIAGHRTTYSAPFRDVDDLHKGDEIVLRLPYGRFTYEVQSTRIVPPDALEVLNDVGYERVVLTACHPLYSAAERIVVFARLVRSGPPELGDESGFEVEEEDDQGRGPGTEDSGGPPGGLGLILVLVGLLAGAVGLVASVAALLAAGLPVRSELVLTLAFSLGAVSFLVLALLGVVG